MYQQKVENLLYQTETALKEEEKTLEYLEKEYLRVQESTKTIQEKIVQYQEILTKKLPFYQQYLPIENFDEEIQKSTYVDVQQELGILKEQQAQMNKELGLEAMEKQKKEHQEKIV